MQLKIRMMRDVLELRRDPDELSNLGEMVELRKLGESMELKEVVGRVRERDGKVNRGTRVSRVEKGKVSERKRNSGKLAELKTLEELVEERKLTETIGKAEMRRLKMRDLREVKVL